MTHFLYVVTRKTFHFHQYSIMLSAHVNELGLKEIGEVYVYSGIFERLDKRCKLYWCSYKGILILLSSSPSDVFSPWNFDTVFHCSFQKVLFKHVLFMCLQQRWTKVCGLWLQDLPDLRLLDVPLESPASFSDTVIVKYLLHQTVSDT